MTFAVSRGNGAASFGWSVLAGGGWSLLNILLLAKLAGLSFNPEKKSFSRIAMTAFLKFPLLYGAGFVILSLGALSREGLFIGFSIPFLFIFLQALTQTDLLQTGLVRIRKIYG